MSTSQITTKYISAETYEGLCKLSHKLKTRLKIDYISDDGTVRIRNDGDTYNVDPNGRCKVSFSDEKDFDLTPTPTNP